MAAYRRVDDIRSPAAWLPVHRDQLRAQRLVSNMGRLYLYLTRTFSSNHGSISFGFRDIDDVGFFGVRHFGQLWWPCHAERWVRLQA